MKFGILANESKQEALELKRELLAWMDSKGIEASSPGNLYCQSGDELDRVVSEFRDLDLIIVLGGDGTLIHASLLFACINIPLLGVNFGRLGFLTSLEKNNLFAGLEKYLQGNYYVEKRMMLDVFLYRDWELVEKQVILNDAVISKDAFARMVDLKIKIDGQLMDHYSADGLIVSSPTGSTAYSLSAGGPIVVPHLAAMIITPICAHTLYTRPMVLSSEEIVEVTVTKASSDVMLTCDGQKGICMKIGDWVKVQKSKESTRFVRFYDRSFYDILHEKLSAGNPHG